MKLLIVFSLLASAAGIVSTALADDAANKARSQQLFLETAKVFRHPRCMNCHPSGDKPTQGNDMHPHLMNVMRGPKDHGAIALQCMACHGNANNVHSNVPGAPKWALAPRSMGWQGLNNKQLCEAIKDKKKNHGMSLEKLIEHNGKDELVAWGWNPGKGRDPVPGTQEEFGKLFAEWVATGAHCPDQ